MRSENVRVPVAEIDTADGCFRISSRNIPPSLKRSIRRIGLLFYPLLLERNGKKRIVCGFRRIAAMVQLGCREVPASILPSGHSLLECARLAIAQNTHGRDLNPLELCRAYRLLLEATGTIEAVSREAHHLDLPSHLDYINGNLQIEKMRRDLQVCLRDGSISLSIALRIAGLDGDGQHAIVALFNRFKPGLNRQKELLSLIDDIARREDRSPREIIASLLADPAFDKRQQSVPQGLKHLLDILRVVRYPSIAAAERRFLETLAQLQPGSGIQIDAPKNYESTDFFLRMRFSNRRELERRREQLARLIAHPSIDHLFS